MANISGAQLQPIYERLNNAPSYHPMEADTFADWAMEAGDIVTVSRDGREYTSPVQNTSMTWKKSQQITLSSTGSNGRESVTKISQRKYGRGGSSLRNSAYQELRAVDSYNQMVSGLILTGSAATLYATSLYGEMRSGLELTTSAINAFVADKYSQMVSGLALTSSSINAFVSDKYSQMVSGLAMTSSSINAFVSDKYSQMVSGLVMTSSSINATVADNYAQMKSGLALTSSSINATVADNYAQMKSGLALTSSSAHLYVDNKYAQMKSGLALTSSTIKATVDNKYAQMVSGLALTSSSARLYVDNKTTTAEIVAKINARGQSQILIRADEVQITGNTTLAGVMTVAATGIRFKEGVTAEGNMILSTPGSWMSAPEVYVRNNLYINSNDAQYKLNYSTLGNMIKEASVNGNTLTLKFFNPNISDINFRKAVTLTGDWSNGKLTVTSSPASEDTFYRLLTQKSYTWQSDHTTTVPIYATYGSQGQYEEDTNWTVFVDATSVYRDGQQHGTHDIHITNQSVRDQQPSGTVLTTLQSNIASAMNNPSAYRGRYFRFDVQCGTETKGYYFRFGS